MGCSASRLDENGLVIPLKARPLLLFRLEEFKKRRHPQSRDAKQEFLLEDHHESDNAKKSSKFSPKNKDNRKESSLLTDDTGSCVTSEEDTKGGRSPGRDDSNRDRKANEEVEKSLRKDVKEKEQDHSRTTSNEINKKVENRNIDRDNKIEDDDDEEEEEDYDDGRMLGHDDEDDLAFHGSPSFRVYFTDNNGGDNKNEDTDDEFVEKAPIEKDDEKQSKPPTNQEIKKKQKKKRSFKNVLPSGRQAKNLFNVRACMSSPHHQSNPDRTHLLTGKAHA